MTGGTEAEEPRFLTLQDVKSMHEYIMEQLNSYAAPLRDKGLLESAVMRARMARHY